MNGIFGYSDERKNTKIKSFLKEHFGVEIKSNSKLKDLVTLKESVDLKIKTMRGDFKDCKDPSYSMYLMLSEIISGYIERKEALYENNSVFEKLTDYLALSASELVTLGSSLEEAIQTVTESYSTSKYRFDEDSIKNTIKDKIVMSGKESKLKEAADFWPPVSDEQKAAASEYLNKTGSTLSLADVMPKEEELKAIRSETGSLILNHVLTNLKVIFKLDDMTTRELFGAIKDRGDLNKLIKLFDEHKTRQLMYDFNPKTYLSLVEDEDGSATIDRRSEVKDIDSLTRWVADALDIDKLEAHRVARKMVLNHDVDDAIGLLSKKNYITFRYKYSPYVYLKEEKEKIMKQVTALMEGEVEEAEVLIAAKGFGSDVQTMIEKIGRLQNEDLPPVCDHMREVFGYETTRMFSDMMTEQLTQVLNDLRSTKEKIDNMVSSIATGELTSDMAMDQALPTEAITGEESVDLGDAFGGAESASGDVNEPLGRSMKESKLEKKKALKEEMEKLAAKLSKKKRK